MMKLQMNTQRGGGGGLNEMYPEDDETPVRRN